ncbi:myo-inositol 2-dehydrogenase/D-chiro-inositol 1-dehydrogenase [Roseimicrobium gellanilyticum]|uniref:Myo-inositol 2-dehydrogenase/D-chiro-inositol 1-dehydrogenase n=1 Tax=Roseimicrobium gellanilyticum TaxID=748857 RepID=A0A366HR76_9BACT|nr:Gfo/Idh/MocA family oxidoreductase [Roseimicrobium gellanilyticum]RBP45423.1 myo-inositol 2-dehydrogenase/D-chiro-inositol 1-dehydrogenase [Roseimicrobium gellanilyticum]
MSKKLFFGLAGFGAWGRMHAQSITSCPDAELKAIVAPSDVTRAEARSLYPNATIHADVSSMLAAGHLDIVDIVTPSHTHLQACREALEAGCHVLLEKPMALSVRDCRTLTELASSKQRMLAIGHELRLSSQWGEVKRRIEQGVIGTPRYVLVELSRKPYRLGASGWRYDGARVGSWVLEEPIHFFDLARWYLSGEGDPVTVYGAGNSIDSSRPHLHDNFSAIMKYESGAYAVISQTLAAFEHHQTVKVAGTKGAIWAAWSGAMDRTMDPSFSLRVFDGKEIEEVKMTQKSGEVFELREEIAMCVRCVREGSAPAATGMDGLWSTALCLAAEQSIETGKTVHLQEFLKA